MIGRAARETLLHQRDTLSGTNTPLPWPPGPKSRADAQRQQASGFRTDTRPRNDAVLVAPGRSKPGTLTQRGDALWLTA